MVTIIYFWQKAYVSTASLFTPLERTRIATTIRIASQDLQRRDFDVCAILGSLVNTAKKVRLERSLVLFRCFLGNFSLSFFFRNIVLTP